MAKFQADFTNVSEGGGRLPAGEYVCKVTKCEVTQGEKAKNLKWTLTVGLGDHKGDTMMFNTSLSVKALFKLREFMIACGQDVPKAVVAVDTDKLLGSVVGIKVVDTTYKDKTTGEEKPSTEVKDIYEVKKTDKGWVRAAQAEAEVNLDAATTGNGNPPWAAQQEEDVTEIEIE
jgi:hypothetical protein